MAVQNCAPSYQDLYQPVFVPSDDHSEDEAHKCTAPTYHEHRSRIIVGTDPSQLFFRSKYFGPDKNQIAVECTSTKFNVYLNANIVEQYNVLIGAGGIANLRGQISGNANSIIQMPTLNYDIYDTRTQENDGQLPPPAPIGGLAPFAKTFLTGGTGGPTDASGLNAIRTGPQRTMFILISTETDQGADTDPPASRRTEQWNGMAWISYCNFVQGDCPLEGTC